MNLVVKEQRRLVEVCVIFECLKRYLFINNEKHLRLLSEGPLKFLLHPKSSLLQLLSLISRTIISIEVFTAHRSHLRHSPTLPTQRLSCIKPLHKHGGHPRPSPQAQAPKPSQKQPASRNSTSNNSTPKKLASNKPAQQPAKDSGNRFSKPRTPKVLKEIIPHTY